jgi:hypothetical protein
MYNKNYAVKKNLPLTAVRHLGAFKEFTVLPE